MRSGYGMAKGGYIAGQVLGSHTVMSRKYEEEKAYSRQVTAPGRGVAQHGCHLAQVHHEGALGHGHALARGDAREYAVCEAHRGLLCRHE